MFGSLSQERMGHSSLKAEGCVPLTGDKSRNTQDPDVLGTSLHYQEALCRLQLWREVITWTEEPQGYLCSVL